MKLDNFLTKAFSGRKAKESRLITPESESELEKVFNGTITHADRSEEQVQQQQQQRQNKKKCREINGDGCGMENGTTSSGETPVKSRSISLVQMRGSKSFETSERKTSFSYLSLLEKNGGNFPHRTQTIMENSPSRKNSLSGSYGNLCSSITKDLSQSMEYLHNTSKRNFMARSNPIGLAEPSIKRDGYAVGKDGSFYRSSEHIFTNLTSNGRTRASSSTPDRDMGPGDLKATKQRHSSLSNLSGGVGIRPGAGLISTGKRNNVHMFMPFGQSSNKEIGYKKTSSSSSSSTSHKSQSQTRTTTSSFQNATITNSDKSSKAAKEASTIIKKGIEEIEYLTKVADRPDVTIVQARSTRSGRAPEPQENRVTSNDRHDGEKREEMGSGVNGTFQALDMMLKSTLADEPIQFTVKRAPRARSLSRTNTFLPDQSVTISLPASRQTSRNSSVEPEGIQRQRRQREEQQQQRQRQQQQQLESLTSDHRSSSVEIFNGTYEMRVPHPASRRKLSAEISEIKTEVYSFTANSDGKCQEQKSNDIIPPSNESPAQEMPNELTMTSLANGKNESFTHAHSEAKPPSSSNSMAEKRESGTTTSSVQITSMRQRSDEPSVESHNTNGVGSALKGLTTALENLQNQQNEQKSKLLVNGKRKKRSGKSRKTHGSGASSSEVSVSVNVSLNSSRRSSRQTSPDRSSVGSGIRSRRNSMDLFSADYDMKMKKKRGGSVELRQKSSSHIQYDDNTKQDLKLCSRCHSSDHLAQGCTEFDDLRCPRCLEWDHWEDTCPFNDPEVPAQCNICDSLGHKSSIHAVTGFQQRRVIVDTMSWEPFVDWFYESIFRSWWQLNGCVGVPLYKIYRRKTDWRTEVQPIISQCDDEMSDFGRSLVRPQQSEMKNYSLSKTDSLEELMKTVRAPRALRPPSVSDDPDSGRSTPEHLKKYSGSTDQNEPISESNKAKRLRTFSETLKLLDDDILAELNIDK